MWKKDLPSFVGADPEVFLKDKKGNYVSSVGKFGGTKAKPLQMSDMPSGFCIQEDNVALEFNIPPCNEKPRFVTIIHAMMERLQELADKQNLRIDISSSAIFPKMELQTPQAQEFGCEEDFNVWELQTNPRPEADNKQLRSCGGHVHIGYKKDNIGLGRACDLFMGCPSIAFDADIQRRLLYGKAGTIRYKPYGIEYRTPSNYWLRNRILTEMIFNQVQQAVAFVDSGEVIPDEDGLLIIQCINNSDKRILKHLTKQYKLEY